MAGAALANPGSGGATQPPPDVPVLYAKNRIIMLVAVMLTAVMQLLDTTIANVAIPHMQTSLNATVESVMWVLTSYIIASAVALPITGWLGNRIGARRLLIISTIGFIVASALCGLAQNLAEMVAFRAIQGVAGAFILPISQALMLDVTRPSRHGQMMAIWGMAIVLGPILGPILGGWLTEVADWRWIFFINLPIGVVAVAMLVFSVPHRETRRRPIDFTGFALMGVALASLQLLLDRGTQIDWFSSIEAWIYLGLCLSGAWIVIIHLANAKNPLFDLELFGDRNLIIALVFMTVAGVVISASSALLPTMLQNLMGYDVLTTGWVLASRGVGFMLAMQIVTPVLNRGLDARPMVLTGMLMLIASLYLMASWSLYIDQRHLVIANVLMGLAMGLMVVPVNTLAFVTLNPALRTEAASLLNLLRALGGSVGISVATVMLARSTQIAHADIGSHLTSASSELIDLSTLDAAQSYGDAAYAMANAEVTRQAMMIAYINDYYLMMWMTVAILPLVILIRTKHR